jgi:hypothetical protein
MKRKKYYKSIHINITYSFYEYLSFKSEKTGKNISEIIRDLIMEDINNNLSKLISNKDK